MKVHLKPIPGEKIKAPEWAIDEVREKRKLVAPYFAEELWTNEPPRHLKRRFKELVKPLRKYVKKK